MGLNALLVTAHLQQPVAQMITAGLLGAGVLVAIVLGARRHPDPFPELLLLSIATLLLTPHALEYDVIFLGPLCAIWMYQSTRTSPLVLYGLLGVCAGFDFTTLVAGRPATNFHLTFLALVVLAAFVVRDTFRPGKAVPTTGDKTLPMLGDIATAAPQ